MLFLATAILVIDIVTTIWNLFCYCDLHIAIMVLGVDRLNEATDYLVTDLLLMLIAASVFSHFFSIVVLVFIRYIPLSDQ